MKTAFYSIAETFNVEVPDHLEVEGIEKGHPQEIFVPETDELYVFRRDTLMSVLGWWNIDSRPLYLFGEMGTGKTSLLLQVAARLNIPVQMVSCHDRLETPDLIGRYVLNEESGMDWVDGPLITAMRHGHLLILDEIDYLNPATAAGLNNLREGLPVTIPETNEVVKAHPRFRMAVTGNTCGMGDEFGVYQGTNRLNQAFLDGFTGMRCNYPDKDVETQILTSVMGDEYQRVAATMVDVANAIRKLFMGNPDNDAEEALEVTASTRTLIAWAKWRLFADNHPEPWKYSMERALTWRATPETKAAIDGIIEREFG